MERIVRHERGSCAKLRDGLSQAEVSNRAEGVGGVEADGPEAIVSLSGIDAKGFSEEVDAASRDLRRFVDVSVKAEGRLAAFNEISHGARADGIRYVG